MGVSSGPSKTAVIFVGLLVIIAGCTTTQPTPAPATPEKSSTPTQTSFATTQPTPTNTPSTGATTQISNTRTTSKPTTNTFSNQTTSPKLENLTPEKKKNINETLEDLYDKVNESNREEVTEQAAIEICKIGPINAEAIENVSDADRELRRVYHASKVWNDHFGSEINPDRVEDGIDVARKAGKYAPVVGSYNRMQKSACNYSPDDPESRQQFYMATTAFGIELALIQNSVFWRGASAATRTLSHTAPYRMVQSVFGDSAYGFVMSETYWIIHGSLLSADDFIIEHADNTNISWNKSDLNFTDIKYQIDSTHSPKNLSDGGPVTSFSELRSQTSIKQIASCAKDISQDEGTNAAKLGRMLLFDGELDSSEWKELSNTTQESIKTCVLNNSTTHDS